MNARLTNPKSTVDESVGAASDYGFEQVSDADLLSSTRRLVGRSNQLLAHLAEVEARGIHRLRACPSLYAYCVYELRLSEDAAFRRARAARVARMFPAIFRQVADGELHLTALVLLAPHLTEENHLELLALAKHRTKREVLRIVRKLAPQATVPDRIEPLGPEPVGIPIPSAPGWRNFVESFAAGGRELAPGDSPKDWVDRASADPEREPSEQAADPEGARCDQSPSGSSALPDSFSDATAAHERYRIEFTASQEYVDLLERARDLLSHAVPNRSLEEVHLRAIRLLVEQLEKRKYGAPRPKAAAKQAKAEPTPAVVTSADPSTSESTPAVATCAEPSTSGSIPAVVTSEAPRRARQSKKRTQAPRQRGAAPVRREVRDRDGLQCTFVDEFGQRCRETRFLELHHELAHALGGRETARNLTMRCQAHNALAAEQDFGRKFVHERIAGCSRRHR